MRYNQIINNIFGIKKEGVVKLKQISTTVVLFLFIIYFFVHSVRRISFIYFFFLFFLSTHRVTLKSGVRHLWPYWILRDNLLFFFDGKWRSVQGRQSNGGKWNKAKPSFICSADKRNICEKYSYGLLVSIFNSKKKINEW